MQKISIFGSTGHVGRNALEVALACGFDVIAISGNKNHDELIRQAKAVMPKYVCVCYDGSFAIVSNALSGTGIEVLPRNEMCNVAAIAVDVCFMSIAGVPAIEPTFACLGHASRLAIASKEAIIIGGKSLRLSAMNLRTEIVPVDSEHNSIFQALVGEDIENVARIILTASGGPFANFEEDELANVSLQQALTHPNWKMGAAITIDSATMMNKAKEIIEAAFLFDIDIQKVESLIHKKSIIHGIVEFMDGTLKAVLAPPDMIYPIANAINHPKRIAMPARNNMIFEEISSLDFSAQKAWQKRNMSISYRAFNDGKVATFVLANDLAVSRFLDGKIKFTEIYEFIVRALEALDIVEHCTSCDDIVATVCEIERQLKLIV